MSSSNQDQIMKEFLLPNLTSDGVTGYLQKIESVALKHTGFQMKLKNMENYMFKVGTLDITSFEDKSGMLEEWEQVYLPDHMFMTVIGVFENFPCHSLVDEMVLMVCEDGKVFAYEGSRLHLVANSLKELFDCGLQFPGTEQYYRGQSFEDMTEEEWDEVNESEEVKKMIEDHKKMVEGMKDSYLRNLDIIMGRREREPPAASGREPEPGPVL